jgi:GH25 family lysozyme M1 (1,4-beta-N-acetylmuramidase)
MKPYPPTLSNGHSFLIDVSVYQNKIDWTQVATAWGGLVRGAYIRWSKGPQHDTRAMENIDGALNAGLEVGTYMFCDYLVESDGREQVQRWISEVQAYAPEATGLGYCIDVERRAADPHPDKAKLQVWFANAFEAVPSLRTIVYTNIHAVEAFGLEDIWPKGSGCSVARWVDTAASDPAEWGKLTPDLAMGNLPKGRKLVNWQFSSKGRVPGVPTNCDLNMMLTSEFHIIGGRLVAS